MNGESASVDQKIVNNWIRKITSYINGYVAKNIFNVDETGLFFSMKPEKTFAFKGEQCSIGKKSKERLTILFCVNSDGTEKIKPLVIGKYANPRCLKGKKIFTKYLI